MNVTNQNPIRENGVRQLLQLAEDMSNITIFMNVRAMMGQTGPG